MTPHKTPTHLDPLFKRRIIKAKEYLKFWQRYWQTGKTPIKLITYKQRYWKKRKDGIKQRYWRKITRKKWKPLKATKK